MAEKPILFSGPMVRAILAGRKTQTRRVVKGLGKRWPLVNLRLVGGGQDTDYSGRFDDPYSWGWPYAEDGVHAPLGSWLEWCPYGKPGDSLWVREAWARTTVCGQPWIVYRTADTRTDYGGPWKPGIHMPRHACRLELEVTAVRVQRLQAISEDDAAAEGVEPLLVPPDGGSAPYAEGYRVLWDSLNDARGFGWIENPWVWVVEFKNSAARGSAHQMNATERTKVSGG